MFPEPEGGCTLDIPFEPEDSTASYSLHIDQLLVSVLTAIYFCQSFSHESWEMLYYMGKR